MLYRLSTQFRTEVTGKRLPDKAELGIDAAPRYYRARDHAAAARVCDEIPKHQPHHFDALHLHGVLHLAAQRLVRRVGKALSVERFKYEIEGDQHGVVAADQ